MIAVDTNLLVYAHRKDNPFHAAARLAVASLAEGRASWAIPWPCLHEFFSIVTHPRIYAPPSTLIQTTMQIDAWLESPSLLLLAENEAHWLQLRGLVDKVRLQGVMVHDARIAAICMNYGRPIVTSAVFPVCACIIRSANRWAMISIPVSINRSSAGHQPNQQGASNGRASPRSERHPPG